MRISPAKEQSNEKIETKPYGGVRGGGGLWRRRGIAGRLVNGSGGATFENLIVPYQRGGRLKLVFRRLPATPKMEYVVDVEQRRPARLVTAQKRPALVGGISYEIRADRDYIQR